MQCSRYGGLGGLQALFSCFGLMVLFPARGDRAGGGSGGEALALVSLSAGVIWITGTRERQAA